MKRPLCLLGIIFLCATAAFAQREQEIKKYEDTLAVSREAGDRRAERPHHREQPVVGHDGLDGRRGANSSVCPADPLECASARPGKAPEPMAERESMAEPEPDG